MLAASTVTNTGDSTLYGNLGVSPGLAITGFPPGLVVAPGIVHAADGAAGQAQAGLSDGLPGRQGPDRPTPPRRPSWPARP